MTIPEMMYCEMSVESIVTTSFQYRNVEIYTRGVKK